MSNKSLWTVPDMFSGRTVAIIATGPSLTQEAVDSVKAAGIPAIAVNNGYEYAPFADILYACDKVWWDNYADKGRLGGPGALSFAGIKVTLAHTRMEDGDSYIKHEAAEYDCLEYIGLSGAFGFDDRKDHIKSGKNSACMATHIAAHAGASRILLLGCDCNAPDSEKSHSFGHHSWSVPNGKQNFAYPEFLKGWEALAPELVARGIEVINTSEDSAIECFEKMDLKAALPKV